MSTFLNAISKNLLKHPIQQYRLFCSKTKFSVWKIKTSPMTKKFTIGLFVCTTTLGATVYHTPKLFDNDKLKELLRRFLFVSCQEKTNRLKHYEKSLGNDATDRGEPSTDKEQVDWSEFFRMIFKEKY